MDGQNFKEKTKKITNTGLKKNNEKERNGTPSRNTSMYINGKMVFPVKQVQKFDFF